MFENLLFTSRTKRKRAAKKLDLLSNQLCPKEMTVAADVAPQKIIKLEQEFDNHWLASGTKRKTFMRILRDVKTNLRKSFVGRKLLGQICISGLDRSADGCRQDFGLVKTKR